jgi:phosphate transport system substrate-binding protein
MRRFSPLVGAASLALVLAACGGGDTDTATPTSDAGATDGGAAATLSGQLNGAGASSQAAAMQAWQAGVQALNPDLTVNYDPVGSGGGREQFIAGGVDFAGSDAALDEDERASATERCGEGFIQIPAYISPIAVAFNLPGIDSLNMDADTIARVFNQEITTWDDPAIADLNPDVELPSTAITTVNRSDESGTTENFEEYLFAAAPDVWTYEPSGVWPVSGGEAAQGTSGVVAAIQGGEGTIGYADASQIGELGTVAVQVGEEFVPYSSEAAAAIVDASPVVEGLPEGDLAIELQRDTTESGVYPIVLVSYSIACQTYDDPQTAANVKGFFEYIISPEGQQTAAENAGSAPISEETRASAQAAIDLIQTG